MSALWRHRPLRLYLLGQAVSLFGDSILWLAAAIWVKSLTGSSARAGLVFFAFTAPQLLAPLAGALVDRLPRRRVLIAANVATGAAVLILLAVNGRGTVWLVYAVMALYGASNVVIGSAQSALLPALVPGELLSAANGALVTVREGLRLVAPLAGAGLFAWQGGHAVALLDAATFVVVAMSLLFLRVDERHLAAPRPTQRLAGELAAGVRHVLGAAELRRVIASAALAVTVLGASETVVFAVVDEGLHRAPSFLGVLLAVQGVGAVLGGAAAPWVARRSGDAGLCGLGMAVLAGAAPLLALPVLAPVLAGMLLFGAGLPWIVIGAMTLLQRSTPDELQGRAYSAAELLIGLPQTLSVALGAGLVTALGYRLVLGLMTVTMVLAAGRLLARQSVARSSPGTAGAPRERPTP